jgi:alpha-mannosidase
MMFRFNQANEIAHGLIEKNYLHLASKIDFSKTDPRDINIVVVNPCNYERDEVVTAYVDIPQQWSGAYAIDPEPLTLLMEDDKGNPIPVQPISDEPQLPVLQQPIDSPLFLRMNRHRICFPAEAIPAFGYRCFKLTATTDTQRQSGSMVTANNTMENEHLRVTLNSNGTWNIYDKQKKTDYKNMGYLWDCGEVGDPWTHVSPKNDRTFTSTGLTARLCLEVDGPLLTQYGIYIEMDCPVSSAEDGRSRSEQTRPIKVKHTLTLAKQSHRLDVVTEIDNPCEDHWLRLMFPTDLNTDKVHVEGQFDVLERPIPRTEDTSKWPEPPLYPNPMNSFVDYSDNTKGLAFINYGLKEYEALDDKRRTFALTLMRCFPLKIGGVGMQDHSKEQKDSQCLGKSTFRYAVYPHKGNWQTGDVFKQVSSHNQEMNILQVGKNNGTWLKKRSFIQLEPTDLQITAVKKAESDDAFVIRFFNPTKDKLKGSIKLDFDIASAHYVTLEEKPLEQCKAKDNTISIEAAGKKIVTVKIFPTPE